MIIFNVWALVVVPSILGFMWCIHLYLPSIVENPYGNVVTGVFAFLISGIYEMIGVKGRLFFIPIWLLSMIGICVSGYQLWGIMFVICTVIALVLFFWLLHVSLKRMENKQLAMLPEKWTQFSASSASWNPLEYWTEVKNTQFFPIILPYTDEVVQHNRRVTDSILERMGPSFSDEERQVILNYQNLLRLTASGSTTTDQTVTSHDEMKKWIDQKIKSLSSAQPSENS